MRGHAFLCAALLAACSDARFHNVRYSNSSSTSASLSTSNSTDGMQSSDTPSVSVSTVSPPSTYTQSSITITSTSGPHGSPSITPTLTATSHDAPSGNVSTTIITPTTLYSAPNTTSITHTNGSTSGICTGCVLEAYNPITTWFTHDIFWTSVLVTETVMTQTISYFTGTPEVLETVVTTIVTVNQTTTMVGSSNQTISHSTPVFTITPTSGVELEVPVGTYIIYPSIFGGLDRHIPIETGTLTNPTTTGVLETESIASTCTPRADYLRKLAPTATEDWSYYIHTIATITGSALMPPTDEEPYSLPPDLVDYLKQDPDAQTIFSGSDIATCTLAPSNEPDRSPTQAPPDEGVPSESSSVVITAPLTTTVASMPPTSTWLSTTYRSTSTHITVRSCLRCDTAPVPPVPGPTDDTDTIQNRPRPTYKPNNPNKPPQTKNENNRPNPIDPPLTFNPQPQRTQDAQVPRPNDKPRVTIGTDVYIIHPARPTNQNPNPSNQNQSPNQPNPNQPNPNQPNPNQPNPNQPNPNQPNPNQPNQPNGQSKPTGVVIGTNTFTLGQTTTWNGVPVVVPSSGGGSIILVGGSSVAVNPAATAPPVLTIGDTTVTANPQGQFIVGTQTLAPGKPAVTIDGTTLQLGPGGTVAIVNGQTQSLGHAPLPTNGPAITIDGQVFPASVIGGTTVFAIGSRTLTPGGVLTQDGTTFSMPSNGEGSTVVVNGVTSTLAAPGLPVLTLGSEDSQSSITASVRGGTTAFILSPGQTLTPGGVVTISGTTYSLPASASGSLVVINGETSTLGQGPITAAAALTIDGKTYSATVRDGTTEFVLGEGTTLKPGESIVVSGTTYSLDPKGTALVVNGKTSTIPRTPASNSATTTKSSSKSESTSDSSSSSTTSRDPGDFIASGLGISESRGGAGSTRGGGLDKWVEGAMVSFAGWLLMFV